MFGRALEVLLSPEPQPGDMAKNCLAPRQGKWQTGVVCTSTYLKEDRAESPRAMALGMSRLCLISYYGAREGNTKRKPLAKRSECKNSYQHKGYLNHCSQLNSVFKAGFLLTQHRSGHSKAMVDESKI